MSPAQEAVLIALTRSTFPRTAESISVEIGYSRHTVRRAVQELRAQGHEISHSGDQLPGDAGEYRLYQGRRNGL